MAPVVDGLDDAAETKGQPFQTELGFHARVNTHRKAFVSADAAAAQTQIENPASQPGSDIDEKNDGRGINLVPGLLAAFAPCWLCLRRTTRRRFHLLRFGWLR
jgi:hypothetical protein